jgi:hypothetical protein
MTRSIALVSKLVPSNCKHMDGSPPLHECLQQIILFDLTLPDLILIPEEDGTPHFLISSVLRPGPARRVDPRPNRPGPVVGPGLSKKQAGNWPGQTWVYFFYILMPEMTSLAERRITNALQSREVRRRPN